MAEPFSPSFWLGTQSKKKSASTYNDAMEKIFVDKFGVDTFTFVHDLYSFLGRQWEVENAYAYLQEQMDIIWRGMRMENDSFVKCDCNPFWGSATDATSPDGSPWARAAVG